MKFVGKSVLRDDAYNKVTGRHEFAIEARMPGMLSARLFRSPVAHARIKALDVSKAIAIPGVVAVLSAADLPKPMPLFGSEVRDQPLLADGESKYHGEPVAVVLAETDEAALAGVAALRIDFERLPAVVSVEQAIEADAPKVHSGLPSNVCKDFVYRWGDVDKAVGDCARVYEDTYRYPMINHFALEPYSVIAHPDNGGVTIRAPIQHPFLLRRVVGECLSLELSRIRVVASSIGGGFGGKGYAKYEPLAAYLALRLGRPVKITTTLDEAFFTTRRLAATIRMRTGFDRDGRIVIQDVTSDYLMGAFADAAPRIAQKAGFVACGPYRIPHLRNVVRALYSNTVPATAMRGFGMPPLNFALETQMQLAARDFGLDPVEIRLRNLVHRGEVLIPGDTPADGEWSESLRKCAELIGWDEPREPYEGRGISIGIKNPIPASVSNAVVKYHADNSLTIVAGTSEMGQGARTVFAQIAAEELGIPLDRIRVIMGDTGAAGFDSATAGSRSTVTMGNAIVAACKDLSDQIEQMARDLGLIEPDEAVEIKAGVVSARQNSLTFSEIFTRYYSRMAGEVVGTGTYRGTKAAAHPLGGLTDFWELIVIAVKVKVDPSTGQVRVTRMANVSDIGKAINPLHCKAQEEGGAMQGMGGALMEQMIYDAEGRLRNGGPLDYRIPTIMDAPPDMRSALIENQDGAGPYGAKGIGESGCITAGSAVANAIADATTHTFKSLPITPEHVWAAIRESEDGRAA